MAGASALGCREAATLRDPFPCRAANRQFQTDPPLDHSRGHAMTEMPHRQKQTERSPAEFSPAEAKRLVRDLFERKPWIYWTDFLVSYAIGSVGFVLVRQTALFSPQQALCFLVSALAFYRAALFIHEIVHFPQGTMRAFRVAWNLLCGTPFLLPSFVYQTHHDHHRKTTYATDRDGEYLPFARQPRREIVKYLLSSFVIPPLVVFRFAVLSPLAWISPRIRAWVHAHASSMVIDPRYIRPRPTPRELFWIRVQEALCFLWVWGIFLVPPLFLHRLPIPFLIQAYATSVFVVLINAVRTLGAHRYVFEPEAVTFADQVLDSLNYPHGVIAELWAPVGLRYHAVHHLFPAMPYHHLGRAHRRLTAELPADSPYHRTVQTSLMQPLVELWHAAGHAAHAAAST
ncbi:MAG: fatty acid desaturase family protein [Thermogutta sp.]